MKDLVLDGLSYASLLTGKATRLPRDAIYWHFPGYLGAGAGSWRTTPAGAIRAGEWKLLEFFEDSRLQLYNLREDIGEQRDLAKQLPDKVKELHTRLAAWRTELKAPMPRPKSTEDSARPEKQKSKKKGKKNK